MSRAVPVAVPAAVLLTLLLVVAGCQTPGSVTTESPTVDASPGTEERVEHGTVEATGDDAAQSSDTPSRSGVPDDPPADRLGWEDGYWHNETVAVTPGDGLNESELDAVVARSMARVEHVRGLEFEERVPVQIMDREEYRDQAGGEHDPALERFDNAKFEALFLVGEGNDSIERQEATRGESVLGYYNPASDAIVVVSDSDAPAIDESTLAHELVHALQDQHFDLNDSTPRTRDAYQGRNGLVEGDATFTQHRYEERCGGEWECLSADEMSGDAGEESGQTGDAGGESAGTPGHFGIQFLMYFPYSDGPGFVEALYEDGGWAAVDAAYDDVPDGSTEVIAPERYGEWEPESVEVRDRSSAEWERVRPPDRPDRAVFGQSAIVATFAYTLTDEYNDSAVVAPTDVVNYRTDGSVDPRDPFAYDVDPAAGWAGGTFYAYQQADDPSAEAAYVWKTRWESERDAREFARAWGLVVDHWGGERVAGDEWVVRDSEFADAVRIRQDDSTVTVVNAPERADLSAVHDA